MAADSTYLKDQVRLDVGDIGRNATHEILFPADATGGTWNYTLAGATASDIAWPNSAATVQEALEELIVIGPGNICVTLGNRGFILEYQNELGGQAIPIATVNGLDLLPEGAATASVAVQETKGKPNHWTDARIDQMWNRRDSIANIELRFLYVKLDAIEELKGLVWTQINEETGDQKREYEKQFEHLKAMEASTFSTLENLLVGTASDAAAAAGTSVVGQPAIRQKVQSQFDAMRNRSGWCR